MDAVHGAAYAAGAHSAQAPVASSPKPQPVAPDSQQQEGKDSPQSLQLDQENGRGGLVDALA